MGEQQPMGPSVGLPGADARVGEQATDPSDRPLGSKRALEGSRSGPADSDGETSNSGSRWSRVRPTVTNGVRPSEPVEAPVATGDWQRAASPRPVVAKGLGWPMDSAVLMATATSVLSVAAGESSLGWPDRGTQDRGEPRSQRPKGSPRPPESARASRPLSPRGPRALLRLRALRSRLPMKRLSSMALLERYTRKMSLFHVKRC